MGQCGWRCNRARQAAWGSPVMFLAVAPYGISQVIADSVLEWAHVASSLLDVAGYMIVHEKTKMFPKPTAPMDRV